MIKVFIVDDQAIIREGLSLILGLYEDLNIIGQVNNGKEALEFLNNNEVDVILMDIRMPVMNGVEAVKAIRELNYKCKIIMLTTFNEDEYIFEALSSGANGYFLKDVEGEKLYEAIKNVNDGKVLLHEDITEKVVKAFTNMYVKDKKDEKQVRIKGEFEELTERESEIARLVMEGLSNKEIAEKLYLSIGTVKNYISKILDKLELRDRTQIAIYLSSTQGIYSREN